jgi:hypothetical protein
VSAGNVLCRIRRRCWIIGWRGFGFRFHRDSPQLYTPLTLPLIDADDSDRKNQNLLKRRGKEEAEGKKDRVIARDRVIG